MTSERLRNKQGACSKVSADAVEETQVQAQLLQPTWLLRKIQLPDGKPSEETQPVKN